MPEGVTWEELETLVICVQGVSQLSSGCRDQEISKACPLTSHFIMSAVRGPEVVKLQPLTELCGLQVSVKIYIALKGPLQFKRCQLMICAPVCCLWCVSPLRGVLYLTAAA